jgi:hypothetical protein
MLRIRHARRNGDGGADANAALTNDGALPQ